MIILTRLNFDLAGFIPTGLLRLFGKHFLQENQIYGEPHPYFQ